MRVAETLGKKLAMCEVDLSASVDAAGAIGAAGPGAAVVRTSVLRHAHGVSSWLGGNTAPWPADAAAAAAEEEKEEEEEGKEPRSGVSASLADAAAVRGEQRSAHHAASAPP